MEKGGAIFRSQHSHVQVEKKQGGLWGNAWPGPSPWDVLGGARELGGKSRRHPDFFFVFFFGGGGELQKAPLD